MWWWRVASVCKFVENCVLITRSSSAHSPRYASNFVRIRPNQIRLGFCFRYLNLNTPWGWLQCIFATQWPMLTMVQGFLSYAVSVKGTNIWGYVKNCLCAVIVFMWRACVKMRNPFNLYSLQCFIQFTQTQIWLQEHPLARSAVVIPLSLDSTPAGNHWHENGMCQTGE
jgi:hypothetical protein